MRIYGSIQISFWENSDIQCLSDQSKLLAIYLLTGPHSNMLGCFRLPDGYITEDLKWEVKNTKNSFQQLSEINFLTRDCNSSWIVVHQFLKWNPIQNPRQGVGIQKLFDIVPTQSKVFKPLINGLLTYGKYLDKVFADRLHSLQKISGTVSQDCLADKEQNQNQNQNQEQDQKRLSSLREEVVSETDNPSMQHNKLNCPHEDIIALYHKILTMCPQVLIWNKTRRSYLKQRWIENPKHQDIDWWKKYFEHVAQSIFLTGQVPGRDGKPAFVADLEWLVRPNNFAKVIEGKYHGVSL